MESTFSETEITGADFTNAVLSRDQKKELCARADGVNSASGVTTKESLGC